MKEFFKIFKKVKGFDIIKQYIKAHVFFYACFAVLFNGFSKKSLEIVRLMVDNKILNKLRRKYRRFIDNYVEPQFNNLSYEKCVWICWWQGLDNAPSIVKKCVESIYTNAKIDKIVFIDSKNYSDYVDIPRYIIEKFNKGIIGFAHFSDLLRLELLIKYGGIWVDATVYMTENKFPDYIMDSDLFVYQILKPGLDGHSEAMSNWLISARPQQRILVLTRDLLYKYWKTNNSAIDYYIFHKFFQLAIEKYPEDYNCIPKVSSETSHILLLKLFEKYDSKMYKYIIGQSNIHKLTYKFTDKQMEEDQSYYSYIIKN